MRKVKGDTHADVMRIQPPIASRSGHGGCVDIRVRDVVGGGYGEDGDGGDGEDDDDGGEGEDDDDGGDGEDDDGGDGEVTFDCGDGNSGDDGEERRMRTLTI